MAREITIDKAGRFVIPKELRDVLALRAGSRLKARVEGDRLVLDVVRERPAVREHRGLLVACGELDGSATDHRQVRATRLHHLADDDTP